MNHWIAAIRQWLRTRTPKKIVTFTICVLLLITPSLFAMLYVYHMDNVKTADHFSVTLYDSDGNELGSDTGIPNSAAANTLVEIFYDLTSQMDSIPQAPGDPENDPYVRAMTDLNGTKSDLKCYFSFVDDAAYCIDSAGKIYSIHRITNELFLNTPYAEPFYAGATPPRLLTIDNEEILPSSASWKYQNANRQYMDAARISTTDTVGLYEITGEIGIRFESEPDYCRVQVLDGEEVIYSSGLHGLSAITVDSENELTIRVHAEWHESEAVTEYGEIDYEFLVRIHNRSLFTLTSDTIPAGGFTVLSCTNITDLSKITFTSDIEGYAPVFHRDGDYVRALLAVPKETELTSFDFRVAYGASARSFTVKVDSTSSDSYIEYPALDFSESAALTEAATEEWNGLLSSIQAPGETAVYFRGNFLNPYTLGFSLGYAHNSRVLWGEGLTQSFVALGSEFRSVGTDGERVAALNSGVVIYEGESALLGKFVVVDHGCGLRTWYGHLSDTDVVVGEVVAAGESVGKTGKTGLATADGFLILCTVYNTVIDPHVLFGVKI